MTNKSTGLSCLNGSESHPPKGSWSMSDCSGSVAIESAFGCDCWQSLFLNGLKLCFAKTCLGESAVNAWLTDHAVEQFGLLSSHRAFCDFLGCLMGFGHC